MRREARRRTTAAQSSCRCAHGFVGQTAAVTVPQRLAPVAAWRPVKLWADMTNKISDGDDEELPRLLTANHCMMSTPVMEAPAPCARYQGCDAGFPVIWCQTQGKMHDRQDALAPGAFWGLFSSL